MSTTIRAFQPADAPALGRLSAACQRGETDFVLNPLFQSEAELFAEFERHRIEPREHLLVAESGDGEVVGMVGFLRAPQGRLAGMICPVVSREDRGHGVGGDLLRAGLELGSKRLGIEFATAGIGTRNRSGYALLTSHGFRPVRQHYLMRCETAPERPAPIPGVELGAAKPEDVDAIHELYCACGLEPRSAERTRAMFEDGRHEHSVAREDGEVVGFVELETHWPERVWVSFVGVSPETRNRGIGAALVTWSVARRFEGGAKAAQLMLSPANRTALRAYEKVGLRRYRLIDVLERAL